MPREVSNNEEAKEYVIKLVEALLELASTQNTDELSQIVVVVEWDRNYLKVTGNDEIENKKGTKLKYLLDLIKKYNKDWIEKQEEKYLQFQKNKSSDKQKTNSDSIEKHLKERIRNSIEYLKELNILEHEGEKCEYISRSKGILKFQLKLKGENEDNIEHIKECLKIISNNGEDLGDYLLKNPTTEISEDQLNDLKPYFNESYNYLLAWAVMEGISTTALSKWIDLDNYNSSNSLRIESFWKIVLEDFKNLPNGTPSLISVLKTLVVHPKIDNSMKEKIINWLQRVKPEIDLDESINLNRPVKAYLLVTIEQNPSDDSLFVKAELKIENKVSIPLNVPLKEQSSDRYSPNFIYQNNSLEQLIPQYIEKLLDRSCPPYLRGLPSGYKLLIEIFLPFEYLAKSVDLWSTDRKESSQRKQKFGNRYRVIVRSYDRFKETEYLNKLKIVWKQMKDIDQQNFGNFFKRLEKESNYNYKKLENELRQQSCIGLSCLLPETEEDQNNIFFALLDTGVPLALWLRSRNIEGDYREDFDRLLCPKCLQQDCEGLIDEIFKKRQLLPNDLEAEKQWGYHTALLLDNPDRTPSFNPLRFGQ